MIDGADLPIYNINALKVYEVSKYVSMTFHNYGPTLLVMNLDVWKGLTPEQQKLFMDVGREAQKKIRELTESVDNLAKAKEILEAKGMKVNAGRRGLLPQGRRGEDLAAVQAAVRRAVGQGRQRQVGSPPRYHGETAGENPPRAPRVSSREETSQWHPGPRRSR